MPNRLIQHRAFAPVLIGLLGLAISLIGIGVPSIWYDEAATITAATRSWPELWQMTASVDAVHALYYSFIHIVFDVFGYSPVALRVPSAIAVGVGGALTVLIARVFVRRSTATIAGLVFCLLPRVTWMGTEGRSYAITAVLTLVITYVFIRAVRSVKASRGSSIRWWILYGVVVVLACGVFLYLALIVIAHGVALLWWFARTRPAQLRTFRYWLITTVAAALCILPFALIVIGESAQLDWLRPLGLQTVRAVLVSQWFYGSIAFAVVGWLLLVLGAVALFRARRSLGRDAHREPSRGLSLDVIALPIVVVPTVLLVIVSLVSSPIYTPRYASMGAPFVAMVMAVGIVTRRRRWAIATVLVLIAALAIPQIISQRQPAAKERSTWSAVASLIQKERTADGPAARTAMIYGTVWRHPFATTRVIEYAYPGPFRDTIDATLETPAARTGTLWETEYPLSDTLDRLTPATVAYLITSRGRDRDPRPETTRLLEARGWHLDHMWNRGLVSVLRYERN